MYCYVAYYARLYKFIVGIHTNVFKKTRYLLLHTLNIMQVFKAWSFEFTLMFRKNTCLQGDINMQLA